MAIREDVQQGSTLPQLPHNDAGGYDGPPAKRQKRVYPNTRCYVGRFQRLLDKLSDEQAAQVKELGFGGLLQTRVSYSRNLEALELLLRLDSRNCTLKVNGHDLVLTDAKVGKILGLPCQGSDITTMKKVTKQVLHENFGFQKSLYSHNELEIELLAMEAGPRWQARFLLYAIASFLCPSTNNSISTSVIGFLDDMKQVSTMNWAGYVKAGLCKCAARLRQGRGTDASSCHLTGCTTLLELFYAEHLDIPHIISPWNERHTPRIQDWNDSCLNDAFVSVKVKGGFDSTEVPLLRDAIQSAIGQVASASGINIASEGLTSHRQPQEEVMATLNIIKGTLDQLTAKVAELSEVVTELNESLQLPPMEEHRDEEGDGLGDDAFSDDGYSTENSSDSAEFSSDSALMT